MQMKSWLAFFRFPNLATAPGDALAGSSLALAAGMIVPTEVPCVALVRAFGAAAAALFLYMYGLADNDIVDAVRDASANPHRPIPSGSLSIRVAKTARGLCWGFALLTAAFCNLPPAWWLSATVLTGCIICYNRCKHPIVMGLCRGLSVVAGACAVVAYPMPIEGAGFFDAFLAFGRTPAAWRIGCAFLLWTIYIASVTKYSEGEETDEPKRRRVGFLIGGLLYLQLGAMIFFPIRPLLVTGAVLLVLARLSRRLSPDITGS